MGDWGDSGTLVSSLPKITATPTPRVISFDGANAQFNYLDLFWSATNKDYVLWNRNPATDPGTSYAGTINLGLIHKTKTNSNQIPLSNYWNAVVKDNVTCGGDDCRRWMPEEGYTWTHDLGFVNTTPLKYQVAIATSRKMSDKDYKTCLTTGCPNYPGSELHQKYAPQYIWPDLAAYVDVV